MQSMPTKKNSYIYAVFAAFLFLCFSQTLAAQDTEAQRQVQALPVLLRLDGVGEVYGVALGVTNVGNREFDLHVGAAGGDVKGGGVSVSEFDLGPGKLNFQFASLSELNVVTQYARSTTVGPVFQQELSGSGYHLGYVMPLQWDDWDLQYDFVQTKVSFESFRNKDGEEININMDGLTDVNSTVIGVGFNWDNREAQAFSEGAQFKHGLLLTQGRDGQADQGQWNFKVAQHLFLSDDLLLSAYVKGSHAFILSELAKYDTDAEIRAQLDAQCDTLTGTEAEDCVALEESLVSFVLANNKYGTANAIGGNGGLRSYSEQFFRGANSWLEGVEMEYRLPSFSVFSGDRALHAVVFAESAQVNDKLSDLFDDSLHTVGLGFRTYAEDLALRLETAHGEDGNAWVFSVGLPY